MKRIGSMFSAASGHRARARAALMGSWGTAVLMDVVAGLLSGSLAGPAIRLDLFHKNPIRIVMPEEILTFLCWEAGIPGPMQMWVTMLIWAMGLVLGGAMAVGLARYYLDLLEGRPSGFRALGSGRSRFRATLGMNLVRAVLTGAGIMMLVVPGMVVSCGFAMAPCILAEDPACSGREALVRSWRLMRGHKLELCALEISFLGWHLLSSVTFGVGRLLIAPYRSAARASFYQSLRT